MNYVGIDIHKRHCMLCAQDETGRKLKEVRVVSGIGFASIGRVAQRSR